MRKNEAPATDRWTIWVGLLGVALIFLAGHFGYEYRVYPALVFIASIGIALAAHWSSRRHLLFWLAALVLVVVHTALVILLPWPTWKMSGPEFAPFAFMDFFANFAAIRWTVIATNRQEHEPNAS
jgi:hypothetical protein